MSIWQQLHRLGTRLAHGSLDALLPRQCLLCATACKAQALCPACLARLPALHHLTAGNCPVCAHPHGTDLANGLICGHCLAQPPHFEATVALYSYAAPVDQLIQSLKYGHHLASAQFLATRLQTAWAAYAGVTAIDRVVPMPLAPARLAERGFNQAVELARPLARALNRPLELAAIHRDKPTAAQASLPWAARAANIRHAFSGSTRFDGEHLLVIDDVMTTGATLNELAKRLKQQGAARVTNLVVARTLRH